MAHQGYFGFTHAAGQQYNPQPSAYPPSAATYVPATAATYAAAPRAGHAQYGYEAGGHPTAYTYTAAPPAPSPAARAAAVVTVAVTPQYQAVQVKPSYTSGYSNAPRAVGNMVTPMNKPQNAVGNASGYSYVSNAAYSTPQPVNVAQAPPPPPPIAPAPAVSQSTGSSYDAALYSAANSYYQQKQQGVNQAALGYTKRTDGGFPSGNGYHKVGSGGAGGRGFGGSNGFYKRRLPSVAGSQNHYCEICKISCAGPLTYKEHLEGQKHKKKEAQSKAGSLAPNMKAGQSQLKCDLCDITCTGTDAYTAHIRGSKHQKTLSLHQRLGKPIPSSEPTIVTVTNDNTTTEVKSTKPMKMVTTTPGIKFVGGTTLQSLQNGETKEVPTAAPVSVANSVGASTASDPEDSQDDMLLPGEKAVQPVGNEYVDETFDNCGKLLSFYCKLCDCKFSDPNAKNMHLKGRRHRTNFKNKVDPTLFVDTKPNPKFKRLQQDRLRERNVRETLRRQRDEEMAMIGEIRMLESDRFFIEPKGYNELYSDRIKTHNDRHVMAKHHQVYPTEKELQAIQVIVTACEKALKLVSDLIHEENEHPKKDSDGKDLRLLKGVMRVGDLAKGLLLHEQLNIELVVLCSEKPTKALLERLYTMLPDKLKEVAEDITFEVSKNEAMACLDVSCQSDPPTRCSLTLTSPLFREQELNGHSAADDAGCTTANNICSVDQTSKASSPVNTDLLDKQTCLNALAALRHSKWFQARAATIPSCVPLLRVFKDLKMREDKFKSISMWAIELLLERCMTTAVSPMGPGDAMRRFFEALSSGLCLPGGPGLSDPCEKDPVDAFSNMNAQSREMLTCYAQMCLRYIAFNQIHKILGIEPISGNSEPVGPGGAPNTRKRPFSATDEDADATTKKEVRQEQDTNESSA